MIPIYRFIPYKRAGLVCAVLLTVLPFSLSHAQDGKTQEPESTYVLQPDDVLGIRVFNEPDLSTEQKVDPNGMVLVPLLGHTDLAGKTLREAESFLEQRFIEEDYLIHPQVTVTVVKHAAQVFYVFGEVNDPGAKTFPSGETSIDILEAITLAGDLSQYAKQSDIVIRRPIPETDREEKISVDLKKMIRGNKRGKSQLIQVYPQDIIFVPERLF